MALKLYNESDIQAIANAIRGKNGESTTYKVSQMADAIDNIPSGGSAIEIVQHKYFKVSTFTTPTEQSRIHAVDCKAYVSNYYSNGVVLGSSDGSWDSRLAFTWLTYADQFWFCNQGSGIAFTPGEHTIHYEGEGTAIMLDDQVAIASYTGPTGGTNYTVGYIGGLSTTPSQAYIEYLKISNAATSQLIANYVGATITVQDGTDFPCIYDTVSKKIFVGNDLVVTDAIPST
jgi:hypothetical protein